MGNHTIGNKRGSVRGAPPEVYLGFTAVHGSEEEEADAMRPVIHHFACCGRAALYYLLGVFIWVIIYAFSQKA